MSAEAQLEALLDIIVTSARQAIAEYKKDGNQVPTIHSKTYHPIDFATDTVALKKAVRVLEGSCQQLCASLAPPQQTLFNMTVPFEGVCVDVILRTKIADVLERDPKGLHVDELAKLVGVEKGNLTRVLRFLATKGCFTEVEPNVFSNNRISRVTLSDCDVSVFSRMRTEDVSLGVATFPEWMADPDYATSADPNKSPLMYAVGQKGFKGTFFDWIEQDVERHKNFHRAMMGVGLVMGSLSVLHHYPWNEMKTVCDIGASVGTVSIPLSKMYPHLKIFHHDLPEVVAKAKDIWARESPEAVQNNQVEFVSFNFLEQSPVKGQDVYYLRNIIHDWADKEAMVILRKMREAMAPHSRLLIHDYILMPPYPDPNMETFGVGVAPQPMLPNFGSGSNRTYQLDLTMWFYCNAKERSLSDLMALGTASGLQLEKVYDLAESAVLEFRAA